MEDISAVKIPAFVSSVPALWFGMLESTFELAVQKPITDDRTKYNYCVAHLSPDAAMAVRDPDGHGYELVSSVRALVSQKFSVEEELMHVKHEVKSPHVGVMWKFGRRVISSGIVLVT
ncbi:uncharacterized protein TNCV_583771 [Trichonephila clavipes]|nr:uncharacterized protein TNCV_583771 [Trichonephila clavipes]